MTATNGNFKKYQLSADVEPFVPRQYNHSPMSLEHTIDPNRPLSTELQYLRISDNSSLPKSRPATSTAFSKQNYYYPNSFRQNAGNSSNWQEKNYDSNNRIKKKEFLESDDNSIRRPNGFRYSVNRLEQPPGIRGNQRLPQNQRSNSNFKVSDNSQVQGKIYADSVKEEFCGHFENSFAWPSLKEKSANSVNSSDILKHDRHNQSESSFAAALKNKSSTTNQDFDSFSSAKNIGNNKDTGVSKDETVYSAKAQASTKNKDFRANNINKNTGAITKNSFSDRKSQYKNNNNYKRDEENKMLPQNGYKQYYRNDHPDTNNKKTERFSKSNFKKKSRFLSENQSDAGGITVTSSDNWEFVSKKNKAKQGLGSKQYVNNNKPEKPKIVATDNKSELDLTPKLPNCEKITGGSKTSVVVVVPEATASAAGPVVPNKSKNKTKGQRKKDFKKKFQSLPSAQGKVLFVTKELHNLVTGTAAKEKDCGSNPDVAQQEFSFADFPELVSNKKKNRKFEVESDDSWSDVDETETDKWNKNQPWLQQQLQMKYFSTALKSKVKKINKETAEDSEQKVPNDGLLLVNKHKKAIPIAGSTSAENPVKSKKPKINSLIQFDISQLLVQGNKKKVSAEKVKQQVSTRKSRQSGKVIPFVANILDSTAPLRRRGKERELPAKKKPSALKKIILKEREEKKLLRLSALNKIIASDESSTKEMLDGKVCEESLPETTNSALTPLNTNVSAATKEVISEPNVENNLEIQPAVKIHNRKFREYCDQLLSPDIDKTVTTLLQTLIFFHDRIYSKDPVKAKMRRRLVLGLRETTKHLKLKRLKCIILAPNMERIQSKGGLDEATNCLKSLAEEQNLPLVFALNRKALGRVCLKKVPVSCVGIFNYGGAEETYKNLMDLVEEARDKYSGVLQLNS